MKQSIKIHDLYDGPVTIEIDTWVRWMTVDQNGSLWAFSTKPICNVKYKAWLESNSTTISDYLGAIRPPKDYKQEIYTWS